MSIPNVVQFASFMGVGALATGVHAGVVIGLVEGVQATPVGANILAFLAANAVSFVANGRLTFRKEATFARYAKFLCVSLVSLFLVIGVTSLGDWLGVSYLLSLAAVLLIIPLTSFVLARSFAFR